MCAVLLYIDQHRKYMSLICLPQIACCCVSQPCSVLTSPYDSYQFKYVSMQAEDYCLPLFVPDVLCFFTLSSLCLFKSCCFKRPRKDRDNDGLIKPPYLLLYLFMILLSHSIIVCFQYNHISEGILKGHDEIW